MHAQNYKALKLILLSLGIPIVFRLDYDCIYAGFLIHKSSK